MKEVIHQKGTYHNGCGWACVSMIMGVSQKEAKKIVEGRHTGTNTGKVYQAFLDRGWKIRRIQVDNEFKCVKTHLKLLSNEYIIYVSGKYVSRYNTKGRDRVSHHAIVINKQVIYDPAQPFSLDLEAYNHTYTKSFWIREILLIENK